MAIKIRKPEEIRQDGWSRIAIFSGGLVHGLISGAVGAVGSTLGAAFGPQSIERVAVAAIAGGNITARSDVGTYTYNITDSCGTAGPHAVKAIAGAKNATYCYDLNGDMVSGDGRTITWSAFGKPTEIVRGVRTIQLAYGPDRSRFRRVDLNETGTTTTHYVAGGTYEVATTAGGQVLTL